MSHNIFKHAKSFKAKKWQSWLYYYSLTILQDQLLSKYLENFCQLFRIYEFSEQRAINRINISHLRELVIDFVETFEILYYNGDLRRLDAMKSNIHAILHLPDDILNCGPGWVFSQLATERILGEIKPDATSKVALSVSLFNSSVIREQLNHIGFIGNTLIINMFYNVNKVHQTTGMLLPRKCTKMKILNKSQCQALYTFLEQNYDFQADNELYNVNKYLVCVWPRFEQYGIVFGSTLS